MKVSVTPLPYLGYLSLSRVRMCATTLGQCQHLNLACELLGHLCGAKTMLKVPKRSAVNVRGQVWTQCQVQRKCYQVLQGQAINLLGFQQPGKNRTIWRLCGNLKAIFLLQCSVVIQLMNYYAFSLLDGGTFTGKWHFELKNKLSTFICNNTFSFLHHWSFLQGHPIIY